MTVLSGVRLFPWAPGNVSPRRPSRRGAVPRSAGAARASGAARSHAVALPAPQFLPRPAALPWIGARPVAAPERRRVSRAERATRRAQPVRALIGVVLVVFLVGLIYLAQAVHLNATNFQIDRLVADRDDLYRQVQTVETSVLAFGTEPSVLDRAQQLGLGQLPTRVRLAAR